jgi:hypothetical protein
MRGRLRTDCDSEKVMLPRAVFAINRTSPPQSSNQLSCTGEALEHLRKAHLGVECRFKLSKIGSLRPPLTKVSPG